MGLETKNQIKTKKKYSEKRSSYDPISLLAIASPVKGCSVMTPLGTQFWEEVKEKIDTEHKRIGVKNVMLPLFIPMSVSKKVFTRRDFNKEFVVIKELPRRKKLSDFLVIRPTSEVLFSFVFSKLIHSYRDLPCLLNQWCNVVRWEKSNKVLLRANEFWWQEGHGVYDDQKKKEERELFAKIASMYRKILSDSFALSVKEGWKTKLETFSGAKKTYTFESLLPDGQTLQLATIHFLSSKFTSVYKTVFRDRHNNLRIPAQISWGLSTRLLGAMAKIHFTQKDRLVTPPFVSPTQLLILVISTDCDTKEKENEKGKCYFLSRKFFSLKELFRVQINHVKNLEHLLILKKRGLAEGVPVIFECRETKNECFESYITISSSGLKKSILPSQLTSLLIRKTILQIQQRLKIKQENVTKLNTHNFSSVDDLKKLLDENKVGFFKGVFCGKITCERSIRDAFGLASVLTSGKSFKSLFCFFCGSSPAKVSFFGRKY